MAWCIEPRPHRAAQRGLTLVELVIALALAGVVLSAILSAWSVLVGRSSDPLVARQSLAIAQSLLREIELQPLPSGAASAPTPGRTGFASFTDYNGLAMNGITDVEGVAVPGLASYNAQVNVTAQTLGSGTPATGWWVEVTVTGPSGQAVRLGSWRAQR